MDCSLTKESVHFKYNLHKKPVGKGSFSTVFLGTDPSGMPVAVKQISLAKIKANQIDKLARELDISMELDHCNIVKYYDVFKIEKYWYIVSEYCDLGTFHNLIIDFKRYSHSQREYQTRLILNQLKDALQYLISKNIIHRDLKPTNILLKRSDSGNKIVKLADFGLSRYFSNEINDTGYDDMVKTVCGSPIYMAPELLVDNKYNMKADLWSFGVIMYELLYGINPYFFPKDISHLRQLIVEKEIKYPEIFSDDCIKLMKSLLTIDPEARINWNDFFTHPWFNIPVNYVAEPEDVDKSVLPERTDYSDIKVNNNKNNTTIDELVDVKITKIEIPKKLSMTDRKLSADYYDIVKHEDLGNIPSYEYETSYSSSIIKLLSDSVRGLFS